MSGESNVISVCFTVKCVCIVLLKHMYIVQLICILYWLSKFMFILLIKCMCIVLIKYMRSAVVTYIYIVSLKCMCIVLVKYMYVLVAKYICSILVKDMHMYYTGKI